MDDNITTTFSFETSDLKYTLPIDLGISAVFLLPSTEKESHIFCFSIAKREKTEKPYKGLIKAFDIRLQKSNLLENLHITNDGYEITADVAYLTKADSKYYFDYTIEIATANLKRKDNNINDLR